jgi:hypothetical protein
MEQLPKEVKSLIMSNLSGKEIVAVCQSNRNLSQVCSNDPKFNSLWRRKIEEEFKEAYIGNSAYDQYKFLSKLYNKDFYFLYQNDIDREEHILLGVYNTYGQAVMAAMDYIEDTLRNVNQKASVNQLRYLLWNKTRVTIDNYHHYWIEKQKLNILEHVYDERNFFANREKLYIDLFGESSNGASQVIPDPFANIPKKQKVILGEKQKSRPEKKKEESKSVRFFKQLDILIDYLNRSVNPKLLGRKEEQDNENIREFVEEWNLNERQSRILNDYLHQDAIFNPQEETEQTDGEDESRNNDSENDESRNNDSENDESRNNDSENDESRNDDSENDESRSYEMKI